MPTRRPHAPSPSARQPANRYFVVAASGVVQGILTMGLLALCLRLSAGTSETLFERQAAYVAGCVLFIATVCGASVLLPYEPVVDGEGSRTMRASVRLTSTAIVVACCYGSVLVFHDWLGKAAFGVSWIWAVSMSASHVGRLVAFALGGRSFFAKE